jgi:hypothetical protein
MQNKKHGSSRANKPKCTKDIYCQFLVAAQGDFTATGMEDGFRDSAVALSHDSVTRWQKKTKLTPAQLWPEVEPLVTKDNPDGSSGWLVIDDMTIEKNRSFKLPMSAWHWSGAKHDVARGLNVVNLLWTADGNEHIPVDFRIYSKKEDGMTRNQHVKDMLRLAQHRGLRPEVVVFDTWYGSQANLNLIQDLGWFWFAPLKDNRIVNYTQHLKDLDFSRDEMANGKTAHLKLVGEVKVFKFIATDGDIEYWVTNKLNSNMTDMCQARARRWSVEEFHRGLKQTTGIGKCQARNNRAQRNHIFCSIRSFVILEHYRLATGTTWYEAKRQIVRQAIRNWLRQPRIPWPESMVSA